jgi:hypothetical protein
MSILLSPRQLRFSLCEVETAKPSPSPTQVISLALNRHVVKLLLGRTLSWIDLAFMDHDAYESMRKLMAMRYVCRPLTRMCYVVIVHSNFSFIVVCFLQLSLLALSVVIPLSHIMCYRDSDGVAIADLDLTFSYKCSDQEGGQIVDLVR